MTEFIKELMQYMKNRKKYWLLPLFIMLLALAGLIILAKGSVVAPFIYTVF